MSQLTVLYACVEAKSRGGDTHIAYAASNERGLNANLISNLSPSSAERAERLSRLFHAALPCDYVGRIEMNLRIHRWSPFTESVSMALV